MRLHFLQSSPFTVEISVLKIYVTLFCALCVTCVLCWVSGSAMRLKYFQGQVKKSCRPIRCLGGDQFKREMPGRHQPVEQTGHQDIVSVRRGTEETSSGKTANSRGQTRTPSLPQSSKKSRPFYHTQTIQHPTSNDAWCLHPNYQKLGASFCMLWAKLLLLNVTVILPKPSRQTVIEISKQVVKFKISKLVNLVQQRQTPCSCSQPA